MRPAFSAVSTESVVRAFPSSLEGISVAETTKMTQENCCRVYSRAFLSCQKRKPTGGRKKGWCAVITVVALVSLCWMYVWLFLYNEQADFDSVAFNKFHKHLNYFMVVMIISALLASYCVLLLLFALVQVALGEKPQLHWLHMIFIGFGVIFITGLIILITKQSKELWWIIPLSLQYVGPFLQFGAVGALTLLSSFVFQAFHRAKKGSKFLIGLVFLVVSAFILLCPLLICSPCLIDIKEINLKQTKPELWGHRGAPMLAPENTLMSFRRSATDCNVRLFETDVQLSKDRIPFLMHDHDGFFLKRTTGETNVRCGNELNFDRLKTLNAGKWFVEADPFHTVDLLTENQKTTAKNQTIPLLADLLQLAKEHKTPVMFDMYSGKNCSDTNITVDVVETILNSKIDHKLIYWLHSEDREYVKRKSNFIHIYKNAIEMKNENGSRLNVRYGDLKMEEIRELREQNISVNLWVVNERWLFSLLWCAGASSVTTNSCQILKEMERPDWTMAPSVYRTIWILVDVSSILIMIGLFVYQWKKKSSCRRRGITNTPFNGGLEITPLV